jgi:transposase-like protein
MLTKNEKIKIAKNMIEKDANIRQIAKKAHLSPNVISALKKEREGISTEEKCTQAYRMFDAKKNNLEVALELGLTDTQTIEFKKGYLRLEEYDRLEELYELEPSKFESLINLMEQLSYYGIHHETYLNFIGNLDSRDELKAQVVDLQNQETKLILKVKDLHQESSYLDSDCKAKKDKVHRLTLEVKRLAIEIVELQKAIEEAVNSDNVTPLVKLILNERLIYNFEKLMGYIQNLDEALKLTVQFDSALTWRLATASYSPED